MLALDREDAAKGGNLRPLQAAIRELFASGASMKGTCRETGVPLATLRNWLRGSMPQATTTRHLSALERYFGMHAGTLTDLVAHAKRGSQVACTLKPIEYRRRLRKLCADRYLLKPGAALERFREEWKALVRYKSRAFTSMQSLLTDNAGRSRRWRVLAGPVDQPTETGWVGVVAGRRCPTAEINFQRVAQFLGWLQLVKVRGGLELPPDEVQTLGQLCNVERLSQFIEWQVERAGGVVNSSPGAFLLIVSTLCHPVHGFLTNTPGIGKLVGVHDPEMWKARCLSVREFALRAQRNLVSQQRPARHPFEPIEAVLGLDNPLDAIADAVRRLDADRPATTGKMEAIWARDRLLLMLTASNPLRARNLRELTWREDNTGHLRRDANGGWRIVMRREEFKNYEGAAKDRDYDMAVQEELWPSIERYLAEYRQTLVRVGCDFVFGSSRSPGRQWAGLNRRFEHLTRRYVHNCPGVGPQSMRHIVATAILKKTGNVTAAALVLHDREETVRAHYAHLIADDGARWLREAVGDAFRRM